MADLKPFTGELDAPTSLKPFDGQLDGEKAKPASAMRKLGDLGLSVAKGVIAVPEAAVGLANIATSGYAGKLAEGAGVRFKDAKDVLSGWQSDDYKAKQQEFQQADGVLNKAGVALSNPSLLANAVAESVPLMGVGGIGARAVLAAAPKLGAVGAGAIGEGLAGAGSAGEQIRQESADGLLTGKQAALAGATGVTTGLFGAAGGKIAQKLGIGDIDTMMANGTTNVLAGAKPKGMLRRGAEGAVSEGFLEELPQSVSEQALQNIALDKDITTGLEDAAVMGALAGNVMGGGAGLLSNPQSKQTPPPVVPPAVPPAIDQLSGLPPTAPVTPTAPVAPQADPAAPAAPGMGFNPDAGQMTQFPDGSQSFASEVPPAAPVKPSEAMGINPTAGPISAAAALSVDAGVTQEIQANEASAADQAAYEQATQAQAQQAAEQDTADKPITTGKLAEAQLSEDDKRAILFSNKAVADGGIQYEGTQDGDILNGQGQPYSTRFAAARRARMEGKDWTIATVFDGYVARRKDANVEPDAVQPADTASLGAGGPDNAPSLVPGPVAADELGAQQSRLAAPDVGQPGELPGGVADAPLNGDFQTEAANVQNPAPAASQPEARVAPDQDAREAPQDVAGSAATPAGVSAAGSVAVEGGGLAVAEQSLAAAKQETGNETAPAPTKKEQAKADVEHLFGVPEKRKKAIERIAKGTAYFGNAMKAGEFIAKNGLKDTHKAVKTSATRWDIQAKDSQPQESTNGTQAPQAVEATQERQEAPAATVAPEVTAVAGNHHTFTPIAGKSVHFASGVSDFKQNQSRILPSYFTDKTGKNAKEWYQGWDAANAAAPVSTSPAVQDFIDGKRDDAPTAEEVNAETELYFAEAKALLEAQKKATGNAVAEAKVRKQLRELAGKVQDGSKASTALDIAATRLGMGEGKLKGLEYAEPAAPASNMQTADAAKGLGEQLAELNAELERQGPVQNANTRAQRDSIRKQIAQEDFPDVLKAVDDDIDTAEEINRADQFRGDEPIAKTIERVLKKRGITDEYQKRWTGRLLTAYGQNDDAPTIAEVKVEARDQKVKLPASVSTAIEGALKKQQTRMKRLRTESESGGLNLAEKLAAQTKVKAAEATLRQMRQTIFDAEDAAVAAIAGQKLDLFAQHEMLFPGAHAAIKELLGQNDELDAETRSYEDKANPTYSGEPAKPAAKPDALSDKEKAAKAKMFNALGKLAALAGKNTRMNWTPEEEQQLLPIVIELFDGAMEMGSVTFQKAVRYVREFISNNLDKETADSIPFETLQGAYIHTARKFKDQGATSGKEVMAFDSLAELEKTAEPAQKAESLTDKLSAEILGKNMPKDNPALKKLVEAFDGKPADQNRMKEAQEALEAAIVNVSRDIVAKKEGTRTTFDVLLRLYQSQPNLNIRTSTSIANQAYSTPAPLAYLGSVLADVTPKTSMYEPTGGNGMLTINALPANVTVNELEPGRIAALKEQGFAKVLEGDALKADVAPKSQDRVMTNPPFGSVKNDKGEPVKVSLDGYKIGQIDHLIAARSLETLKDDGKATLIIGANKVTGGLNTDDRIFFNWLYGNYNITSHFEVDGDLYQRQGAGWPVRVITINGRQKSDRVSPVAGTIQRAQNWEQVYEHFTASLDSSRTESQRKPSASTGGAGAVQTGLQPVRQPAGKPNSTIGGLGQEGGSVSPGNVTGASTGNGANSSERVSGQLGGADSPQRLNAESVESDRLDPAGDAVITAPAKPAGNTGATALSSAENQFQVTYEPRSSRKDGGVLIPVNMKDPTQDALSRLEDAVGNIDDYLTKQLGYNSVQKLHEALMGLQVDSVASAIYQIEQGKGVVIADQTGIGKGRQAAAVIRWAERSGYIPVFVSVKPSLFTDMFGDLHDIGSDNITPFILNKDESIKGPAGEKLFANKAATHKRTIESIRDNGALPQGSNAIFMTYSQVNTDNVQRQMLTTLTDRAVFILDESHNAGGQSSTGEFITSLLEGAKGVTYLSATYAKRPDNMPLYFKTDIGQAAADNEGLMQAMGNGGLPLQTVVSNNLVKAGQMFRRERSYDGVSIETISDTDHRAEHEKLSDETTKALRAIVAADRMFHHVFVKQMNEEMQQAGGAVIDNAGNQAQAGVDHTQFSSVVHNFVKQMLLGLKAQRAANEAIAALKRNEKPIIAVENTMGSFLEAYAKDNMVLQGGSLGSFDYRTVLSRALARTLFVNEVKPNGDKVKREIKLSQLDVETRASYDAAQAVINSLKLDIPVSPIDWMRNEIRKAGFTVAEITGRKLAVDYSSPGKATLGSIDSLEQSDKVRTTQMFNSGRTDALILNVAGSTGISLHASEKFEDKRQRHMIIGQAAGDINIFMQMLGRIHRTGQVVLPKYTILSVDLPTEKRPTAVLSGKMKSLNANTSSNTDSATSIKTVDMFNKYGDQVVAQYLQDNYALARDLGVEDLIGGSDAVEDLAQKATGRLALQPIAVQNAFYDEVEGQYSAMMDYLNKTNQNDLEPRTFDYDARETRQEVLFEGANKDSPFGEDAIYGEYSIKAQGKAMTPVEIKEAMLSNLDGKAVAVHMQGTLSPLVKQFDDYIATLEGPARDSANATRATGQAFMVNHSIGDTFRVDINGDSFNAVVTNIRNTHKANGNPFSLSKIQVTIALNGALRSISVPASQFQKIEVSQIGRGYSIEQLFKEQPANQREAAKIVTGNLLAAYGEIQGARGTIITFTKQDGTTEQGILLPKAFDYKNNTRGDYRLATGADALKFLQSSENRDIGRFGIQSRDGVVRVLPSGRGISLLVPKSKLKGGKYFLDRGLIDVLGDFVTSGSAMKATTYDSSDAVKALDLLMKKNALYAIPSMAEEAKSLASDASQDGAVFSASNSAPEKQLPLTQIERLVQSALRGVKNAPTVRVVANPEAIGLRSPVNTIPSGVVLANGDIYVFQSGIGSALEVDMVVFHELFHKGLQNVLPKADYVAAMQEIAKTDAKVRQYSSDWSSTNAGKAALKELAAKYSGKELADQYEALSIEEGLAKIAEDLKAKRQMGTKDMRVRGLVSWLAKIADKMGMTRLADKLRAMSYTDAEKFVVDTISKSGSGRGPGGGNKFSSKDAKQTDTAAFKAWFGDSKVVNADGKPLVVYHGTQADNLFEFNPRASIEIYGRPEGIDAVGSWFTTDAQFAENFGDKRVDTYLSIKNPAVYASWQDLMDEWSDENTSKYTDKAGKARHKANKHNGDAAGFRDVMIAQGFDGIQIKPHKTSASTEFEGRSAWIAFNPGQIKSATGNNGDFDGTNPDIRFRSLDDTLSSAANSVRDVKLPAGYLVSDLINGAPGKLGWWHKSVGTQYNLAQRSKPFKRVYDAVQTFMNDVSHFATEAADLAPNILPKLETWRDIGKSPLSADDTKALSAPVFEGTLNWARDESGQAVKMEVLEAAAAKLTPDQKAQRLLRNNHLSQQVLTMWKGLPLDQYESMVNGKYERDMLKAGIVFTDAELKQFFSLTDPQIALYREFRAATDKSLASLAIADMLRFGGNDVAPIRDAVQDSKTMKEASETLRDYLLSLAESDPERNDVLTDTANKMIEKGDKAQGLMDRGYAPLSRFGHYTLDVVSESGERVYFSLFESKMEAARMRRKMEGLYPGAQITQGTVSEEAYKMFAGVSPETLELFGDMLGLEAQGDSASAQAFQEYLKLAKSNRSAMKRLVQRQGIAGFSEDAGRVLAGFVYSNARQAAASLHMGEMTQAANDVPKTQGELKDAAVKLVDYIKNPQEEAQALRSVLFAQYIGGSVASAMVNMTQPLTMTFPWLSQYGGIAKAAKQMTSAVVDANKRKTGDAKLDIALLAAEEDGTVSPQEVHQLMQQSMGKATLRSGDGTRAGDALATAQNSLSRVSLAWGKLFGAAEQFNRRVTFIAAYRTAIAEGMNDPEGFARKAIMETQGVYNKGNKPRWARGAIGATLFTFKQYSISYVEMLSRMAKNGPEGKKAALLALGVLFLTAGAGGLPGADDLDDIISGAMQAMGYNFDSKQKRQEFFVELFGEGGAVFMERGISGLPGVPVDLSGRMGLGNLIPATGLFTKKPDHSRDLAEIAGPAGDLIKRGYEATGKLLSGDVFGKNGAIATASPVAARNLFQAYDMANMGMYRDAKGMKVLDTDAGDAMVKALGFQPTDVALRQDASFDVQRMIGVNRMRETEIANSWALGIFEKNPEKVQAAREKLREWNETNPESPIRINFRQIQQRVKNMNQTKAERIARTAPKEIKADVRRELGLQ